nr:MAG TPA: hypothetical protein [Caudoviricetes sp.]
MLSARGYFVMQKSNLMIDCFLFRLLYLVVAPSCRFRTGLAHDCHSV